MENKIVLVTGMSGAGKSSAMNALEDLGYYCMDNFPKELIHDLGCGYLCNSSDCGITSSGLVSVCLSN